MRRIVYNISEIEPYINWLYFYHAWGLSGKPREEKEKLKAEALDMLHSWEGEYHTYAVFGLFEANSEGDDIWLEGQKVRFPMLRQQHPAAQGEPNLCLADFIRPLDSGITDRLGIFCTTVDGGLEKKYRSDDYLNMMAQTLCDRLAEATAEKLHEEVRRSIWGYAPGEQLSIEDQHLERYQGIRPAIGYPSLPDTSANFIIDQLIDMSQVGIRLTTSGMMTPHASVSGLMFAHPKSRYFELGRIGDDQLRDYAQRRGVPVQAMKTYLQSSLIKMIARILIPVVVFTLLPYLWIYKRYGKLWLKSLWQRVLFWLPAFVVIAYSAYITMLPNFLPRNPVLIDIWFMIMAVCAVPQFVFSLFSVFGWCCMRLLHGHRNWGKLLGLVVGAVAFFCFIYGFTEGFPKMQVKRITIYVPNLPKSFEGYRIVQFSDIHLGSYYGWRGHLPQRDIDSINAEKPDLICFTGDLQNVTPDELPEYQALLSSLKARDGVMSVLGNHDYTYYMDVDDEQEIAALEKRMQDFQRSCGWRLLMNEHVAVHRGADSIYVAGTENYDNPKRTNVRKALYGIRPGSFVLMLQHIPKQWRETWPSTINKEKDEDGDVIGPDRKDSLVVAPQLTLSGHTHAGQISILGLRPSMFTPYDYGLFEEEGCQLYTTSGLGGTVPIRIGATAEIVVITLKRK